MRDTGRAVYLQTDFLFDRLTPWSRIFLQLLILNSTETADLHTAMKFITPSFYFIVRYFNIIHIYIICFPVIHFNVIFPSLYLPIDVKMKLWVLGFQSGPRYRVISCFFFPCCPAMQRPLSNLILPPVWVRISKPIKWKRLNP
jgi:hypothetical protein